MAAYVAKGDQLPDGLEVTLFERAYAIVLAAIVRNDLSGDVERAWRVADMVVDAWLDHQPEPS